MEALGQYQSLIIFLLTGLIAGWLVGQILGGGGLIRNLVVGVIGALIGGFLIERGVLHLGFSTGCELLDGVIVATIGAFIFVIFARIIGR